MAKQFLRVNISIIGTKPEVFIQKIDGWKKKAVKSISASGDITLTTIKENITTNRLRPDQHLAEDTQRIENIMNIEKKIAADNTSISWGVGEIDKLDKEAKHWRCQNWGLVGTNRDGSGGRFIHPSQAKGKRRIFGFFGNDNPPLAGGAGEAFIYQKGYKYSMLPQKLIEPKYFVEKTAAHLKTLISFIYKTLGKL